MSGGRGSGVKREWDDAQDARLMQEYTEPRRQRDLVMRETAA